MLNIKLSPREVEVLKLILGVDLDALGLDPKQQVTAASIRQKLKESPK